MYRFPNIKCTYIYQYISYIFNIITFELKIKYKQENVVERNFNNNKFGILSIPLLKLLKCSNVSVSHQVHLSHIMYR